MRTIILAFLLGFSFVISFGQIPNIRIMQNYKEMAWFLEPVQKPTTQKIFFLPKWQKDTLISLRDEITLSSLDLHWKDSLRILKKDSLLYVQIKTFPRDSIVLLQKFGSKKKDLARRSYYEKQRLFHLTNLFDSASFRKDKKGMELVLDILSYYYFHPELLSLENEKKYQELFVLKRKEYSSFLLECYNKNECSRRDVSALFWYNTRVYPDIKEARNLIDRVYNKEFLYLFWGRDEGVSFAETAQYFLSLLLVYNIQGVDERIKGDVIMKGYKKLFELSYLPEKHYYERNVRRYLIEKYGINP